MLKVTNRKLRRSRKLRANRKLWELTNCEKFAVCAQISRCEKSQIANCEKIANCAQIAKCESQRNRRKFSGEFAIAAQSQMILRLAIAAQTQSIFIKNLHPWIYAKTNLIFSKNVKLTFFFSWKKTFMERLCKNNVQDSCENIPDIRTPPSESSIQPFCLLFLKIRWFQLFEFSNFRDADFSAFWKKWADETILTCYTHRTVY